MVQIITDEFRLIGIARTKFGEVHILVEKVFFQFLDIRYFSNCDDGRTPVVIGKKDGAYAATSESSSFPNLDYEIEKYHFCPHNKRSGNHNTPKGKNKSAFLHSVGEAARYDRGWQHYRGP